MSERLLAAGSTRPARARWRAAYLVLISLFLVLVVALAWGLARDPRELPSVLIGSPVPDFSLPPLQGRTLGLAGTDLKGEVSLVNVFASWCTACREEHPLFMQLRADGVVPIHGLNHRDRPQDARWLDDLGDPHTRTGADLNGQVSIDWGVYGVPETFVVGKDGRIAYKHVGAVTPEVLQTKILPLVESLRRGEAVSVAPGYSRMPSSDGRDEP